MENLVDQNSAALSLTLVSGDTREEREAEIAALNDLLIRDPQILAKEKSIPRHSGFEVVSFLTSRVHAGHLDGLRHNLSLPVGYTLLAPTLVQRANTPPPGSFTFFIEQFRCGLRFPLHPIYRTIYERFGIPPSQITPLGIKFITSFCVLVTYHGGSPLVEDFLHFFVAKAQAPSLVYFSSKPRGFLGSAKKASLGWKSFFLYVIPPVQENWDFPDYWIATDSLELRGKELPPLSDPSLFEKLASEAFDPDLLVLEDILSFLGLRPGEKNEQFDIGTFHLLLSTCCFSASFNKSLFILLFQVKPCFVLC